MIKRLAMLLVLATVGCGGGDGRPNTVPNVAGLWRESAPAVSRNDCSGFLVPAVTACERTILQNDDQVAATSPCAEGNFPTGGVNPDGRVTLNETHEIDAGPGCSVTAETVVDVFACDIGANNASQAETTRLIRFRPNGDCTLPAVCATGTGRGRPCATNADCGTNGRCTSGLTCIGGENDNDACTNDEGCPGGRCSGPTCLGGGNSGNACTSNDDCPDGACSRPTCLGGLQPGQSCNSDNDCPGGTCNDRIQECTVVMASTWTRRPGNCVGGANDGRPCAAAADCRPGTCVTTVCTDGARSGLSCNADTGCPVQCVANRCSGGPKDGLACNTDAECPFFDCVDADKLFCTAGLRNNLICSSSADCPCDDETNTDMCPTNRCAAANSCSAGTRVDQKCTTSAECPVFTCGASVCSGGNEDGGACTSDLDCEGGGCIDRPFCVGGTRNGLTCDDDGDCAGGGCFEQPRACSADFDID